MTTRKIKLSVTVSEDVVASIDAEVRRSGGGATRSGVVEAWLRTASQRRAAERLAEETARYYRERTLEQRADDDEWAAIATQEFDRSTTDRGGARRRRR